MSNPLENLQSGIEKKWITVESDLENIEGKKSEIKVEVMDDKKPRAMAFFDIDGTLAHLSGIHGQAIQKIFEGEDPKELEETYYKGFKLGNSFREFDRMRGIYVDGHVEWKDPEVYLKVRFTPHAKEIDEPGHEAHDIAAKLLSMYGKAAGQVAEDMHKNNPLEFDQAKIAPVTKLAKMYSRLGIPIVGFTANEKNFVQKLSKYLGLSETFIAIATDEDMAGGGKEIAVGKLMKRVEEKGISVPKDRLIFVGDSIRGDVGIMKKVREKDSDIRGQGILVLKDKNALIEIKKQISENPELKHIVDSLEVNALVADDVPLDEKGNPMLLSRFRHQFLDRL